MQPKKTSKYECHYPSVAEDSAYHYTNCNWQYGDSLKTYHAKYKDSVAVDWIWNEDRLSYKTVYVHKDADYKGSIKSSDFNELSHNLQYYLVPMFFALIISFFIFGSLVIRDNETAQRSRQKESILNIRKQKK